MALTDNLEQAQRLARAIASDIVLYHEDQVASGIEQDTLFEVIAKEIEEGREHYLSKITPELDAVYHCYDRALIDIIFKQKGEQVASHIWQ